MKEYISIQESAKLSGKSIQTIRRAIKAKKFKVKKRKTPQGFNYQIHRQGFCKLYNIPFIEEDKELENLKKEVIKSSIKEKKKNIKKEVKSMKKIEEKEIEKEQEQEYVNTKDFKSFTTALETMISQHSEERQNFLRLINTLQEKIFILENQMNLLKEPKKKWFQIWK